MSYCKNVSYFIELCDLELKLYSGQWVIAKMLVDTEKLTAALYLGWQIPRNNICYNYPFSDNSYKKTTVWSLALTYILDYLKDLFVILKKSLYELSFTKELKPILEPRLYSLYISDILYFSYCNFHPRIKSRLHYLCWVIFRTQATSIPDICHFFYTGKIFGA